MLFFVPFCCRDVAKMFLFVTKCSRNVTRMLLLAFQQARCELGFTSRCELGFTLINKERKQSRISPFLYFFSILYSLPTEDSRESSVALQESRHLQGFAGEFLGSTFKQGNLDFFQGHPVPESHGSRPVRHRRMT